MRALFVTLAVLLSLGACFSGGDPDPELEVRVPTCRREHCWCIDLRGPQRRDGEGGRRPRWAGRDEASAGAPAGEDRPTSE